MSLLLRKPIKQKSLREIILIISATIVLYFLLSLATYHPNDPGWSLSTEIERISNSGGPIGAWIADIFLYMFGYPAYLFPLLLASIGWLIFRLLGEGHRFDAWLIMLRSSGFVLTLIASCGLAATHFSGSRILPIDSGGLLGKVIGDSLFQTLSPLGGTLALLAAFLIGITLLTGLSWLWLMDNTGRYTLLLADRIQRILSTGYKYYLSSGLHKTKAEPDQTITQKIKEFIREKIDGEKPPRPRIEPGGIGQLMPDPRPQDTQPPEKKPRLENKHQVEKRTEQQSSAPRQTISESGLPSISLLDPPDPSRHTVTDQQLGDISRQVETKLKDFGVEAKVVAVHPGPVITRFEIDLAPGTKVSRITALAKDLARSLSVISVRIVEIIPGKSVIGLELPNKQRDLVRLSEILYSNEYKNCISPLTLVLGKDISGHAVVADLAGMPHLLVAGTTGSGKSVAINAMILSLLYKALPSDVRIIMVDPKMLELSVYEGIPHLLAPVVTDMKEAANALRWCVAEMERRYKLMSNLGVRNMAGFNRKIQEANRAGKPIPDPFYDPPPWESFSEDDESDPPEPPALKSLPAIVVIVDELADMMMVVGKKVEELIARLAQKARAAGIHLILATQRPSVDVLTGLIKANIPTRIAFQVSARVDSRTILDQMGAEQLLGHGDMLYLASGMPMPSRVHGAFVADGEVHKVVDDLKQHSQPDYLDEILSGGGDEASDDASPFSTNNDDAESDSLYDEAVRIVTETRRASISGVQRRLKIGYNRAARMVEQMEAAGVVGPLESNGNREVLAPPPPED
uniref:DNA translocase FtsK n=1 Tax=Candidatus Kentrum sp. TC TaxID=2126339 RepID=A0A451AF37_9GAMM|nr:MAG: DNA segregation ATPase FtsK/SpoIIIE, S-DNA-T family [Candidatus Kentron sp. TC]VFK51905.1 MAG: DNA translocase FtsK [Candidatus Kentron sp. TC]VFK64638.1 MAG: DNA segregation ATPase FtsK/SpoIIIE, S-DNA-T family [Candidatus Kentron sp. TC]